MGPLIGNCPQNTFAKLVLGDSYTTYFEALNILQLYQLILRRKKLTLGFVKRSLADGKLRDLFIVRKKPHIMNTRKTERYIIQHAHTEIHPFGPCRDF